MSGSGEDDDDEDDDDDDDDDEEDEDEEEEDEEDPVEPPQKAVRVSKAAETPARKVMQVRFKIKVPGTNLVR